MEIVFILHRPSVPGNVGAAARAMKTMGFSTLRLIDPCDHLTDGARMMAHGSHEILESAVLFDTFEDATSDLDLIICTTARERSAKHDYHSSRDLPGMLQEKAGMLDRVGILFGTEESGLPNTLILKSDLAVSIPMGGGYPSLNLSQAVMVIAYELSSLNPLEQTGRSLSKSGEGWGALKVRTKALLLRTGIPEGTPLYHRIMERISTVGANDIPLFLSVIRRINDAW